MVKYIIYRFSADLHNISFYDLVGLPTIMALKCWFLEPTIYITISYSQAKNLTCLSLGFAELGHSIIFLVLSGSGQSSSDSICRRPGCDVFRFYIIKKNKWKIFMKRWVRFVGRKTIMCMFFFFKHHRTLLQSSTTTTTSSHVVTSVAFTCFSVKSWNVRPCFAL